jgi:hypothetical protein
LFFNGIGAEQMLQRVAEFLGDSSATIAWGCLHRSVLLYGQPAKNNAVRTRQETAVSYILWFMVPPNITSVVLLELFRKAHMCYLSFFEKLI